MVLKICKTYRMLWAVFGDTGMFGSDMMKTIASHGHATLGLNRSHFDIGASESSLFDLVHRADVIVNAVAYTAVDDAEDAPDEAMLVNAGFAEKLSRVAVQSGSRFMQISTDYVFSGNASSPMGIDFPTEPISAYGRSKLAGEQRVSKSGSRSTIFRTSWLYGSQGPCFPRTIARKLLNGERVGVVDDQTGQPTWTKDLAEIVFAHGLFDFGEPIVHAVSSGSCSWYEFAQEIQANLLAEGSELIYPIKSEVLSLTAKRPPYSVLDNHITAGPIVGDWRTRWLVAKDEVLSGLEKP
jgi:dTDP-4-dehydrorhamnose reductase